MIEHDLLRVTDLSIDYSTRGRLVSAVSNATFSVGQGDFIGIVGESGCGKSTLVKALVDVLPENARRSSGEAIFAGEDLFSMSASRRREIKWDRISLVPQSAMNALNPVASVQAQMIEAIRTHREIPKTDALGIAVECFRKVGLNPGRISDYPHQFSGGMRQRAAIAMSLVLDPDLIVCDEPTTGLDVIVQDQILATLKDLQTEFGRSLILVTHNIAAVAENCDHTIVMYAGKVVEFGRTKSILSAPAHPYTMGLKNAFPSVENSDLSRMISIPGSPPQFGLEDVGCRFAARCPFATEVCRNVEPPVVQLDSSHWSCCHHTERAEEFRSVAAIPMTWRPGESSDTSVGTGDAYSSVAFSPQKAVNSVAKEESVLETDSLRVHFPVNQGLVSSLLRQRSSFVHAVDDVSLVLRPGVALGLAGESGCGKSTTGMTVAGLVAPTQGSVSLNGERINIESRRHRLSYSRQVQVVFQDPFGSLNPRFTIGQAIEEPLKVHGIGDKRRRREMVLQALDSAELRPSRDYVDRFPHQLSGGQRQRVSIARAVVLEPRFLVADEPVSMLDVSVRSGILRLLRRLIDEHGMGLLYISHDLSTMPAICEEIAVMYLGQIVETGLTQSVLGDPQHPYTRALVAAVPNPDPTWQRERNPLSGEVPSPVDPGPGCRFASRCPSALSSCRDVSVELIPVNDSHVRCRMFNPASRDEFTEAMGNRVDSGINSR